MQTSGTSWTLEILVGLFGLFVSNVTDSCFILDIGSIATIAVIGIAAIFVLPQAIYWLTGVNLSSFNWGRSEDDLPGIVGLANTVDHALTEFNIDGKGCMAKSMCDILYGKESEKHGMFVKAIANSAKE